MEFFLVRVIRKLKSLLGFPAVDCPFSGVYVPGNGGWLGFGGLFGYRGVFGGLGGMDGED